MESGGSSLRQDLIQRNVLLAPYTSWLIGGRAEYFSVPQSLNELQGILNFIQRERLPVTVFSGGSNVLISDKGIQGMTICLKQLAGIIQSGIVENKWVVEAWAGTSKSEVLKIFLKQRLSPAIFLAGIPGDLGGGVVMNAGVGEAITPREFVEVTKSITVLRWNGMVEEISARELKWDYRHCDGWQPGIIVRVNLAWPLVESSAEEKHRIWVQAKELNQRRLLSQPLEYPTCGSVFVNPRDHKAALLIESCGLKGYTVGGAQVSLKHANFIINLGGAKGSDVWQVVEHVGRTVLEKTGIELKTEVIRLGLW